MSGVESHDVGGYTFVQGSSVERRLTLEGSRIRPDLRCLALEHRFLKLARIDPSTLSGASCLVERRRWVHREERSVGVLEHDFSSSSSVVFGMYPESYLLCQLTCAREARRVCGGRGTRLCSTSTECTRFTTHLSFETDVGAHMERRVCGECVRGVQNTTMHAVRAGRCICTEVDGRLQNPPFPFASSLARLDVELTGRLLQWVQHGIFGSTLHPSLW
ncbi:hypothetical protein ARMSODRAFT_1022823 [Armillaria solidipes]|uniref:Uncharacterized protein n=1 Tax=Armillaria solidipes TaxID=1076256 RepID=A0A2H3BCS7_9AGAR|nr:hypothetical protein ARMSODRAFT_1022823 [Armillaria solidipes]